MMRDLTPGEIEKHNNRKLTADKIRQILSKVMETPSQSSKRWVWELIQNAKDIPNRYGQVSIKIELTDSTLNFFHNGDSFSLKNVMGLIQQVSSKDSVNTDEEVTGKFGTGFISTHLLSRKISVKGVVLQNGIHRDFNIVLDRSGDSSEELIPKINDALEHISKIEDSNLFPKRDYYEYYRTESSLDTLFTYELHTDKSKQWATAGINDLVNTLPQTLVNIEKIKTVTVVNRGFQEIYSKKEIYRNNGIIAYEVNITNKPPKKFLAYGRDNITLVIEVSSFNPITLVEHFGKQPNLYRDFPLIGSETFYFPYILNGHLFNPTEDRDSILLHSEDSKESKDNRHYIETAISIAQEFTSKLIGLGAKNRYILAFSRRPELKQTWETFSQDWYTQLQINWRQQLLQQHLLETASNEVIQLKHGIIPEDGETKELKNGFYDLAQPILSSSKVPKKEKLFDWLKVLGPKSDEKQRNTWGVQLSINAEDLARYIHSYGNKANLLENTELADDIRVNHWLNSFYSYLVTTEQTSLFSIYCLIPNQNGVFRKIGDLHLEDFIKPIPDELLDIMLKLGEDWRGGLIDRQIRVNVNIGSKGCSDISDRINEILKEEVGPFGNSTPKFLTRAGARDILVEILRLQPLNATTENFQYRLFHFGKDIFQFNDSVKNIGNISPFNFLNATKLFILLIHKEIHQLVNLSNLQTRLLKETEEDTLFWLDGYLNLIQKNSVLKFLLEEFNIIPNRCKQFISYDTVRSFGTEEIPLDDDLVNILHDLNKQEDWKSFLVHDGIYIEFKNKCKFEELSQSIEENISDIQIRNHKNPDDNTLENYKKPILNLIEWIGKSKNKKLAESYLSTFIRESKNLLFKLTIDNSNIGISAIKMLQDEKSVNLLSKIHKSEVPTEDLEEIIDMINELGSTALLKRRAKQLLDEKQNREFLYKVGEMVEEAIRQALSGFAVQKISIGSFDLVISNGVKKYYLEIKSFGFGSTFPFLFAPSQAQRALLNEPNYAICTIERPLQESNLLSVSYIRSHLKFAKQLSTEFRAGMNDYDTFNRIRGNTNTSKLKFDLLGDLRIEVDRNAILLKSHDFDALVIDIRRELT